MLYRKAFEVQSPAPILRIRSSLPFAGGGELSGHDSPKVGADVGQVPSGRNDSRTDRFFLSRTGDQVRCPGLPSIRAPGQATTLQEPLRRTILAQPTETADDPPGQGETRSKRPRLTRSFSNGSHGGGIFRTRWRGGRRGPHGRSSYPGPPPENAQEDHAEASDTRLYADRDPP